VCAERLERLRTIVSLQAEQASALDQIRRMRAWLLEAEHILSGAWAASPDEVTNGEVAHRFDAYLARLASFLEEVERTPEEQECLGELRKVLTHLRLGLIHCYDIPGFPRTNNDLERLIRAIKMTYRRISGRHSWNAYLLRYGRCVAYVVWWQTQPAGAIRLRACCQRVPNASWRAVRQETRCCHQEQLYRFRFQHHPLEYLAHLEACWVPSAGTGLLPL